jgi:hypothetical protein
MKTRVGILAVIILSTLCVAAQQVQVKTHYDPNLDISKDKSFTVLLGTAWGNPTNEEYAKTVVTQQLTAKGYTPATDAASADLLVVIHGVTQDKTSVQSLYTGTGTQNYGWAGPAGVVTTWETEYKLGTGVIDVFDTKAKKLVFRGAAEGEISGIGPQNQKKIDEGITKMFKDFPSAK